MLTIRRSYMNEDGNITIWINSIINFCIFQYFTKFLLKRCFKFSSLFVCCITLAKVLVSISSMPLTSININAININTLVKKVLVSLLRMKILDIKLSDVLQNVSRILVVRAVQSISALNTG